MLKSIAVGFVCLLGAGLLGTAILWGQSDPGFRRPSPTTGRPYATLTPAELVLFERGKDAFEEVDGVAEGLGPRFNLDSCFGCHSQPASGGSSPAVNPQVAVATLKGANNRVPDFIRLNGPAREVRPRSIGGVVDLFVIAGRSDAPRRCDIQQPDFAHMNDLTFRIPTPTFGLGLVESITDSALRDNLDNNQFRKSQLGISGRFNTSGNDGTITRFGWKAQNKSLLIFSGEAYNVEVGVTNDLFPQDREETPNCSQSQQPESHTEIATGALADPELFSFFMRFLAPPAPSPSTPSIDRGRGLFDSVGCALCHTPTLRTGRSYSDSLTNKPVNLFSDLAVHNMGQALADGISQGGANGNEFRTAPLWGLGDRLFFLHDGRSRDLLETIRLHDSQGSEASGVIHNFNGLSVTDKQSLLDFLRSL